MEGFWKYAAPAAAVLGVLMASPADAFEAGDWLVRVRAIVIDPDSSSSVINAPALGGDVPGSRVKIDSSVTPELDFTYMVTRNIGFELILATAEHKAVAAGTAADLGPVLDTWVLPPTLTAQYHFFPESRLQPYLGAGINYTIFYSEDLKPDFRAPGDRVRIGDSFGFAAQAGIDFTIDDHWFINADVKYIDMSDQARITGSAVGDITVAKVEVDPWVYGVGIGYRF